MYRLTMEELVLSLIIGGATEKVWHFIIEIKMNLQQKQLLSWTKYILNATEKLKQ
jgi:hypothetical protein